MITSVCRQCAGNTDVLLLPPESSARQSGSMNVPSTRSFQQFRHTPIAGLSVRLRETLLVGQ
jgi:hypothetical protein